LIDALRWLAMLLYINPSALGRVGLLMKRRKRLLHLVAVRNPVEVVDVVKVQGVVHQRHPSSCRDCCRRCGSSSWVAGWWCGLRLSLETKRALQSRVRRGGGDE